MINIDKIYEAPEEAQAFVKECEEAFERHITEVVDSICAEDVRCLTLAGPSCSGKTTTAGKLTQAIEKCGKRAKVISIDNFYYSEEERHRRGVDDMEGPASLNIPMFAQVADDLANGRETLLPIFSFREKRRIGYDRFIPHEKDIYVFEGIQAIYKEITDILSRLTFKSIFINAAVGIKIADVTFERSELRMLRRTLRDNSHRASPPEKTMIYWADVRKNEEINIYPNSEHTDFIINSTLPYEALLFSKYYLEVTKNYPGYAAFASTVYSMRKKLEKLKNTAVNIDMIPPSSVIREFVD